MLTHEQRKWRADKIGDLANIAVGSLPAIIRDARERHK